MQCEIETLNFYLQEVEEIREYVALHIDDFPAVKRFIQTYAEFEDGRLEKQFMKQHHQRITRYQQEPMVTELTAHIESNDTLKPYLNQPRNVTFEDQLADLLDADQDARKDRVNNIHKLMNTTPVDTSKDITDTQLTQTYLEFQSTLENKI